MKDATKLITGAALGCAGGIAVYKLLKTPDFDTPIYIGNGSLYLDSDVEFPDYGAYLKTKLLTYPDTLKKLDRIAFSGGSAQPPLPDFLPLRNNAKYLVEIAYGSSDKLFCETNQRRKEIAVWVDPGTFDSGYDLDPGLRRYTNNDHGGRITHIRVAETLRGTEFNLVNSKVLDTTGLTIQLQTKRPVKWF